MRIAPQKYVGPVPSSFYKHPVHLSRDEQFAAKFLGFYDLAFGSLDSLLIGLDPHFTIILTLLSVDSQMGKIDLRYS